MLYQTVSHWVLYEDRGDTVGHTCFASRRPKGSQPLKSPAKADQKANAEKDISFRPWVAASSKITKLCKIGLDRLMI